MTANERRAWLESPAGRFQTAMGVDPFAVDHDAADAMVEEVRAGWRRNYGRELDEGELRGVRMAAERRSAPAAVRDVPQSVPELVQRVNARTVNAGWSYTPEFRGQSSGIAMLQGGEWRGDPVVVERVKAAEAERAAREAASGEAFMSGPLIMRTIAGPSSE